MNPIALAGSDTVPSSMSSPLSSHQSQLLQARGWGLSPSSPGSRPPGAKSRPPGAKTRPPGAKFAGHLTRCSLIPWCLYVWAVSYMSYFTSNLLRCRANKTLHFTPKNQQQNFIYQQGGGKQKLCGSMKVYIFYVWELLGFKAAQTPLSPPYYCLPILGAPLMETFKD